MEGWAGGVVAGGVRLPPGRRRGVRLERAGRPGRERAGRARPRPRPSQVADLKLHLDRELERIGTQLRALADAKDRLQGLLDAVLAISGELDLSAVLRRIVTTAMDLVGARYGALGVLHESGEYLKEFVTAGLSEEERSALSGVPFPHGRGVLGLLIQDPEPLRVENIPAHPSSAGFPPGHPRCGRFSAWPSPSAARSTAICTSRSATTA